MMYTLPHDRGMQSIKQETNWLACLFWHPFVFGELHGYWRSLANFDGADINMDTSWRLSRFFKQCEEWCKVQEQNFLAFIFCLWVTKISRQQFFYHTHNTFVRVTRAPFQIYAGTVVHGHRLDLGSWQPYFWGVRYLDRSNSIFAWHNWLYNRHHQFQWSHSTGGFKRRKAVRLAVMELLNPAQWYNWTIGRWAPVPEH